MQILRFLTAHIGFCFWFIDSVLSLFLLVRV